MYSTWYQYNTVSRIDEDIETMDGWQSSSNSNFKAKSKRAFVGNLTPHPNLEVKLRELFSKSSINTYKIDIIKPKHGSNCFALVQCQDVQEAIKCLHGISFLGNVIVVKNEKKPNSGGRNSRNNNGFGAGWAKPSESFKSKQGSNKSSSHDKTFVEGKEKSENISGDDEKKSDGMVKSQASQSALMNIMKDDEKLIQDDIDSFHSRCKLGLNQLMQEYGEYDPDFENMKVSEPETKPKPYANQNKKQLNQSDDRSSGGGGMLAPNGSAPINIELVSFGFKYSVPPQARQGWSHSNPLSPIDCRSLPRCPHYVSKLSGLSYKVKKTLLSSDYGAPQIKDEDLDGEMEKVAISSDNENETKKFHNPLAVQSNEISETIMKAIEEAIEGGHGYAFPLNTIVHIGSEYGRHRSVVLCENIAQNLRKLLRINDKDRIKAPVSVSLRHRDVDRNHKDEEAFGDDLRREHEAEVKRKKKEEWLESRFETDW